MCIIVCDWNIFVLCNVKPQRGRQRKVCLFASLGLDKCEWLHNTERGEILYSSFSSFLACVRSVLVRGNIQHHIKYMYIYIYIYLLCTTVHVTLRLDHAFLI